MDKKTDIAKGPSAPAFESEPLPSEETLRASSRDMDVTYEIYRGQDATLLDPHEARRVLRKIDIRILPLLATIYMLQYLDKSSINFASVYGLQKGTHLHGQDYSWLSSIFYFGYLIAQYPAGYCLQRLPIGKFIGAATIGNPSPISPDICACSPLTMCLQHGALYS